MKIKSILAGLVATAYTTMATCSTRSNVQLTFYGYPNNDPAGADTAYDCLNRGSIAGGTGTYSNPVTFASAPTEFKECEIIYIPYLEKYGIMQDTCEQCTTDKANGKYHIDVWTGSATVNVLLDMVRRNMFLLSGLVV